jgi:hypothetical protein
MNNATTEKRPAALLTPKPSVNPAGDGITHINIAMTGVTELGRLLTHFAVTPFIHPIYGPFKSMEGFWHFIKCEDQDDLFRTLSASRAKSHAKSKNTVFRENFIQIINEANFYKIEQTPGLKEAIVDSVLPFEYYYLYGPENLQIFPKQASWLCAGFEEIRRLMKAGKTIAKQPMVDFSQKAGTASA